MRSVEESADEAGFCGWRESRMSCKEDLSPSLITAHEGGGGVYDERWLLDRQKVFKVTWIDGFHYASLSHKGQASNKARGHTSNEDVWRLVTLYLLWHRTWLASHVLESCLPLCIHGHGSIIHGHRRLGEPTAGSAESQTTATAEFPMNTWCWTNSGLISGLRSIYKAVISIGAT